VARRLRGVCRSEDTLARLAGDEFVLLLEGTADATAAASAATRCSMRCRRRSLSVGAKSMSAPAWGWPYPADGNDIELLRNADAAMYAAKAAGRNTFRFYDEAMNRRAMQRLALESDLRRALGRNQLELFYQPQIRAADNGLAGAEALLRWRHPERGLVSPVEFIPVAEELGIIAELGDWPCRKPPARWVAWRQHGLPVPRVAVNLSPRQFDDPDLADRIEGIITAAGADKAWLELEITESAAMQQPERAIQILRQLRQRGLQSPWTTSAPAILARHVVHPALERPQAGPQLRPAIAGFRNRCRRGRRRRLAGPPATPGGRRRRRGNAWPATVPGRSGVRHAAGLPVRPPCRLPNSRPGSGNGNSRSDPAPDRIFPADLLL
jgi:hypothetical protein